MLSRERLRQSHHEGAVGPRGQSKIEKLSCFGSRWTKCVIFDDDYGNGENTLRYRDRVTGWFGWGFSIPMDRDYRLSQWLRGFRCVGEVSITTR